MGVVLLCLLSVVLHKKWVGTHWFSEPAAESLLEHFHVLLDLHLVSSGLCCIFVLLVSVERVPEVSEMFVDLATSHGTILLLELWSFLSTKDLVSSGCPPGLSYFLLSIWWIYFIQLLIKIAQILLRNPILFVEGGYRLRGSQSTQFDAIMSFLLPKFWILDGISHLQFIGSLWYLPGIWCDILSLKSIL
jgi:hypothetical protein